MFARPGEAAMRDESALRKARPDEAALRDQEPEYPEDAIADMDATAVYPGGAVVNRMVKWMKWAHTRIHVLRDHNGSAMQEIDDLRTRCADAEAVAASLRTACADKDEQLKSLRAWRDARRDDSIKTLEIGTVVTMGTVQARIRGIHIKSKTDIAYDVVWFSRDGVRHVAEVGADEVVFVDHDMLAHPRAPKS